ncbi:hypothetical protein N7540_001822 [Penicillium herquei]|nr:hypothetical protein N7540_001822 [Penicillium herquei]
MYPLHVPGVETGFNLVAKHDTTQDLFAIDLVMDQNFSVVTTMDAGTVDPLAIVELAISEALQIGAGVQQILDSHSSLCLDGQSQECIRSQLQGSTFFELEGPVQYHTVFDRLTKPCQIAMRAWSKIPD